jgi:anti-sigma factor (TIGR02949 family)
MPDDSPRQPEAIDCASAMRQLFDYLDGELTPARELAVRQHLALCARCYPHFAFEQEFLRALGKARGAGAAPLPLRERVMSALTAAGFVAGG